MSYSKAKARQDKLPPGGYLMDKEYFEIVSPVIHRKAKEIVAMLMRKAEIVNSYESLYESHGFAEHDRKSKKDIN